MNRLYDVADYQLSDEYRFQTPSFQNGPSSEFAIMLLICMCLIVYAIAASFSYKAKIAKLESEKADVEHRLSMANDTLASFKEAVISQVQADEYSKSIRGSR